jgi:signal peptidase I
MALFLVRTFAIDVYRVAGASMEPTLFEGERVLVVYDRSPPRRSELVVLAPDGTEPLVKRVVGLPGESVQISRGDCLVDGRRLPAADAGERTITVRDERWHDLSAAFRLGDPGRWSRPEGAWEVDGAGLTPPDPAAVMSWVPDVTDDYLRPDQHEVNDLALSLELRIAAAAGRARIALNEMGDDFCLDIGFGAGGDGAQGAWAALVRQGAAGGAEPEELARAPAAIEVGRWHRLSLATIDDVLVARLDGAELLRVAYAGNRFDPSDEFFHGSSPKARLWLAGYGSAVAFRSLRLSRDLYYTPRGELGIDEPVLLGPGRIFVLGDHSAESRDGREWGPLADSELVGRPIWVIWPPARWRRLGAR